MTISSAEIRLAALRGSYGLRGYCVVVVRRILFAHPIEEPPCIGDFRTKSVNWGLNIVRNKASKVKG